MIQISTYSCCFSSPAVSRSSLISLTTCKLMQTQQIPPNKQERSLQSQQIRHTHSHVSANYGPIFTVMDVISVQQHTRMQTPQIFRRLIFKNFNFRFLQVLHGSHTHPVFYIVFHIPPISFFFFLKDILSFFPLSLFTCLPRLYLFSLPPPFLLFSSKFSCVIPSPRTPLISLPSCVFEKHWAGEARGEGRRGEE